MSKIPGPPPASAVEPSRGPWCDDCHFLHEDTPSGRLYCNEADWAGWVDNPKDPPCGGIARMSRRDSESKARALAPATPSNEETKR